MLYKSYVYISVPFISFSSQLQKYVKVLTKENVYTK